jgi:hypothetical protein
MSKQYRTRGPNPETSLANQMGAQADDLNFRVALQAMGSRHSATIKRTPDVAVAASAFERQLLGMRMQGFKPRPVEGKHGSHVILDPPKGAKGPAARPHLLFVEAPIACAPKWALWDGSKPLPPATDTTNPEA